VSLSSVPSLLQRALLVFVPAAILLVVAVSAVWGEAGILSRHELRDRLAREKTELARIERDNQRLLSELLWLDRDPVLLERAVAEELGWAREGTTLYRFETDTDEQQEREARAKTGRFTGRTVRP
jgi:cell division protein FtsB